MSRRSSDLMPFFKEACNPRDHPPPILNFALSEIESQSVFESRLLLILTAKLSGVSSA